MDPKIFITYSSKDEKVSRTICTALETRGLTCWISSRNVKPGQNYQEQIVRAIRAAKIMVLVFTANANNSNEIKKELSLASKNNLIVIPVRIEDVTPNEAFAYEFATRQWIDLFDDWENSMVRLVEQIVAVLDEYPSSDQAKVEPGVAVPEFTKPRAGLLWGVSRAMFKTRDFLPVIVAALIVVALAYAGLARSNVCAGDGACWVDVPFQLLFGNYHLPDYTDPLLRLVQLGGRFLLLAGAFVSGVRVVVSAVRDMRQRQ
jgi:hypothetical protein